MRRGKALGQHFLRDPGILAKIVEAANLTPEDTVLEIGPGPGDLTAQLRERVRRVVAVEIDPSLCAHLRERFAATSPVEIVQANILEYPLEPLGRFKVVANIPYYLTAPILFRLLGHRGQIPSMTLLLQKEVARRIVAPACYRGAPCRSCSSISTRPSTRAATASCGASTGASTRS